MRMIKRINRNIRIKPQGNNTSARRNRIISKSRTIRRSKRSHISRRIIIRKRISGSAIRKVDVVIEVSSTHK